MIHSFRKTVLFSAALFIFLSSCTSIKRTQVKQTDPNLGLSLPAQAMLPNPGLAINKASDDLGKSTKECENGTTCVNKDSVSQYAIQASNHNQSSVGHNQSSPGGNGSHDSQSLSAGTSPEVHSRVIGEISADKALGWLRNGNKRYLKGFLRKDGIEPADRERLSQGQKPHSIVLSCSDSRVPPEIVFDQKLGEIFVVRSAGESLDNATLASIEYAIEHLGSNLIVVMGHSSCGAVKAAMSTLPGKDAGSPYLNALIADIQPRLGDFSRRPASTEYVREGWENAFGVSKDLVTRSKIIREAIKSGSLKISTALYHLHSGYVEWDK